MNVAGSALLDTSIVIAHLRGDAAVTSCLRKASVLYLPWIVLGELYYGAQRSKVPGKALAEIADFQSTAIVLFPDEQTIQVYAVVKAELANAGTPIPENDVWIAAMARQYGLPVATRDQHFGLVKEIEIIRW